MVELEKIYFAVRNIILRMKESKSSKEVYPKDNPSFNSLNSINVECKLNSLGKNSLFLAHLEISPYPLFFDPKEELQFLTQFSNSIESIILVYSHVYPLNMIKIQPDASYQLVSVFDDINNLEIREIHKVFYFYFTEELDIDLFRGRLSQEIMSHKIHLHNLDSQDHQLMSSEIYLAMFPIDSRKFNFGIRLMFSLDSIQNQTEIAKIIARTNDICCYYKDEYLGGRFLLRMMPSHSIEVVDEDLIPVGLSAENDNDPPVQI